MIPLYKMGRMCKKTIFVAQSEVENFNNEIGENKAIAVPIGVDTDFFSYRLCGNDDLIIGFLGALNVAHNDSAVENFIINIFPHVLEKQPNAKFLIIGGGASKRLKSFENNNIIFTGKVDDVRKYLEKCTVFVCPMTFGSGIKTKNLEAMALGLPVVTTNIGAENIPAVNGREWFIEDDPIKFADEIIHLFNNIEFRVTMGKKASEFIAGNFTWKVAENTLKELLENVK